MYDFHLHSRWSDGDATVAELVQHAAERRLQGISLTDHNGLWGTAEAAEAAARAGLKFIPGIEVTALYQDVDVHLLGYSRAFKTQRLSDGLAGTREGYRQRVQAMVQRCHATGYTLVSWPEIEQWRSQQPAPSYISYDVTKQLMLHHQLPPSPARQLTVRGGACYVPYGDWALTPESAIALLHEAGAIAVLAHPGTIAHEAGGSIMQELIERLRQHGLDGIEAYHPFHNQDFTRSLVRYARTHELVVTGGSDWHGPDRFNDAAIGVVGLDQQYLAAFEGRLTEYY